MTTVTDFRNDPEALAAFISNWDRNPIETGHFFGLRFELADGSVRCGRCFKSKQAAKRANTPNCR